MSAYLLTWNLRKYIWSGFKEDLTALSQGTGLIKQWRVNNPPSIQKESVFFLMRQSLEPKGIIGHGRILEDINTNLKGLSINIKISFHDMREPFKEDILKRGHLKYLLPYVYWDTSRPVMRIENEAAEIIMDEYKLILERGS